MKLKRTPILMGMSLVFLTGCGMSPNGLLPDAARSNLTNEQSGRAGKTRRTDSRAIVTPLEEGRRHYRDGSYGLAEAIFRKEVEKDATNAEAWLGLAASYDRLRRFELAMRAYSSVTRLRGFTPTVLNNLGYHYYLQGNMASALKTLERAHAADRSNPYIINNLKKIRAAASKKGPKRARG